MNQRGIISSAFAVVVTLIIAAGVGGYVYVQSKMPNDVETIPAPLPGQSSSPTPSQPAPPQEVACTMEAKQCPDGSYIGRTGPKCEFAACPREKPISQSAIPADWKMYRNEEYKFEFKYPVDWKTDTLGAGECTIPCERFIVVNLGPTILEARNDLYDPPVMIPGAYFTIYKGENGCSTERGEYAGENGEEHDWSLDRWKTFYSKRICLGKFRVDLTVIDDTPSRESYKQTLEQILSTLRFTN